MTLTADQRLLLRDLWRAFPPNAPLDPADPDDAALYVPLYEQDDDDDRDDDPISRLCTAISWAEDVGSVQLLSGLRGVGKTTELRRAAADLGTEGRTVVYLDTFGWVDESRPLSIRRFLVAVAVCLVAEVQALGLVRRVKAPPDVPRVLAAVFEAAGAIVTKASGLPAVDTKALQEALRSQRDRIDGEVDGQESSVAAEVHGFIVGVLAQLGEDGQVVVLVDSVEKLSAGLLDEHFHTAAARLFTDDQAWLRFDGVHTVYTVPPYVALLTGGAGGGTDADVHMFDAHRLVDRPGRTPRRAGLAAYRAIVERRFAAWEAVFGDADRLDRLCLLSGGQLRGLFFLLREVAISARTLPVSDRLVEQAGQTLRRDLPQFFSAEELDWLRTLSTTYHAVKTGAVSLPRLMTFLDTGLVLVYRNGQPLYDVHPTVLTSDLRAPLTGP